MGQKRGGVSVALSCISIRQTRHITKQSQKQYLRPCQMPEMGPTLMELVWYYQPV